MKYFVEQKIVAEFETDSVDKYDILVQCHTALGEKYEPYVFNDNEGNVKDINEIITLTDANNNRILL